MAPCRAAILACLAFACSACLGGGCRGCGSTPPDREPAAREATLAAQRETRARRERIDARMRALELDRAAPRTRDARGRLTCGEDVKCFVLAAERCEPAILEHRQRVRGYGLRQTVAARYAIVGGRDGRCRVRRVRREIEVLLEDGMAQALAGRGKSEQEIEDFRLDAEHLLAVRNPPRIECDFEALEALEVVLDLSDGRYDPSRWRGRCREPSALEVDAGASSPKAP